MYSITKLDRWVGRVTDVRKIDVWRDLLHDFGDFLPFLIDEQYVEQIPEIGRLKQFKKDALKYPSRTFKTYPGVVWVLMAHLDKYALLPKPFYKPGFLFPLEWKKAEAGDVDQHSRLLPQQLLELADRVKRQFVDNGIAVDDFHLFPWHGFRGTVDFSGMNASFDSAWGALAIGLYSVASATAKASAPLLKRMCCRSGSSSGVGMLNSWPFSSIAFDFEANVPTSVSHLKEKISIVERYGGREIAVAPNQQKEILSVCKWKKARCVRIRPFVWFWTTNFCKSIASLSKCNQSRCGRRAGILLMSLFMFVLPCMIGYVYMADWNTERISYYRDYVDVYGIPCGIYPMTPDEVAHRGQSYRMHYKGYDSWMPFVRKPVLRQMFCVNAFDSIVVSESAEPNHANVACWKCFYDERGRLAEIRHASVSGIETAIYRYSGAKADTIDVIKRGHNGQWGAPASICGDKREKIRRYKVSRNAAGFLIEKTLYRDVSGVMAEDNKGISRFVYDVDDIGRVVCERTFGWNGVPKRIKRSNITLFEYGDEGSLRKRIYADGTNRQEILTYDYDSWGNCTNLIQTDGLGCQLTKTWFEKRMQYDKHGSIVRVEFWDADGLHKFTDAVHEMKYQYLDGRIRECSISYYDQKLKLGRNRDGLSRLIIRKDEYGNEVERLQYGVDGQLCGSDFSKCGAVEPAIIRREYDQLSREICESYFAADGNMLVGKNGYARRSISWIGETNKTIRYFGADSNPVLKTDEYDCAVEQLQFNLDGRVESVCLLDENGERHISKLGWHRVCFKYDRYGNIAEIAYFDTDGNPVLGCGFGGLTHRVAALRFIRDAAGNPLEESFHGVNGEFINGSNGFAILKMRYDERNRLIETECYDCKRQPVNMRSANCTRVVFEYAPEGYKCRTRNYTVAGSREDAVYDEYGNQVATEFYHPNGERRAACNGVSALRSKYDNDGHEIKRGFFGVDGKRTLSEDRIAGWWWSYDKQGHRVEEAYFGLNGQLASDRNGVAIVRWVFDDNGFETEKTYYDTKTNITVNSAGSAGKRWRRDQNGRITEEFSIGADGRPKIDENGVHVVRYFYDGTAHRTRREFYDANMHRVKNNEGVSGWASEMDSKGREIKRLWFDVNDKPFLNNDGYGWTRKYDAQGRVIEQIPLEADGVTPTNTEFVVNGKKFLCGKATFRYDRLGRKTVTAYAAVPGGAFGGDKVEVVYSVVGDELEARTLDADGQLINNAFGWARREMSFNEYREPISESYWDKNGAPAISAAGYHRGEIKYLRNSSGVSVETHLFGTNGYHVIDQQNGWASSLMKYDQKYRLTEVSFYDEVGHMVGIRGTRLCKEFITYAENGRISELRFVTLDGKGFVDNEVSAYRFDYSLLSEKRVRIEELDEKWEPLRAKFVSLSECDQFQSKFVVRYSNKMMNVNVK